MPCGVGEGTRGRGGGCGRGAEEMGGGWGRKRGPEEEGGGWGRGQEEGGGRRGLGGRAAALLLGRDGCWGRALWRATVWDEGGETGRGSDVKEGDRGKKREEERKRPNEKEVIQISRGTL